MPVPLQVLGRHARVVDHRPDDLPYGAGQGCAGVSDANAQGVAEANFHGHLRLFGERHERLCEGDAEAVDVGPCHVLEVAPGYDACLEGRLDHLYIFVEHLGACLLELVEDVVVGYAREHARLLQAEIADKL